MATALRATVLYVATNPVILADIRSEMHAAGIPLNRPTSDIISNVKVRSIPYLVATIKEGLRMHPPVVGALEKQAGPHGDTLPDGRFVPAGTKVQVSTWATQRNPEVFGDDADVFRPSRWLEERDAEKKGRMDRSVELVFSVGRFICMGREIAMTQCLKVISEASADNRFHEKAYAADMCASCSSSTASTSRS